jgi:hypothetical protein
VSGAIGKHEIGFQVSGPGLTEKHNVFPAVEINITEFAVGQFVTFVNGAVFRKHGKHEIHILFDGKKLGHPCMLIVEKQQEFAK